MIKLAAIFPHSPLLHSGIGADVHNSTKDTVKAIQVAVDEIYASQPDTIVIISDQPTVYESHVTLHVQDPIRFDLSAFGDFSMREEVSTDIQLLDALQRDLRKKNIPITLDSVHALHFSAAIPLSYILKRHQHVQLLAIAPPTQADAKDIYEIGRAMQDVLIESSKRIVVVCAGDGSHALNQRSPNTPTSEGKKFDEYMQHILVNKNASSLMSLNASIIEHAHQSMYTQTLLLFGVMHGIQTTQKLHSYESPFGVGYFVATYQPL